MAAAGAEVAAAEAEEAAAHVAAAGERSPYGVPGAPLQRHSPFYIGFFGGLGALVAYFLASQLLLVSGTVVLVVVAAFIAVGLAPLVDGLVARGLRRGLAVLVVALGAALAVTGFVAVIVPVLTDQVGQLVDRAPGWLDQLRSNPRVEAFEEQYGVVEKVQDYLTDGDFASAAFGGVLGVGIAVLSALANTFIIVVLTLYFLASLPTIKSGLYRLAPASRRRRVAALGDQILSNVGAYVAGAFVVSLVSGLTSLVFLFVVGLGEYAVALAFVVAVLGVIPMIGATLGAVVVTAIGFATDPTIGLACLVFYVVYQQVENYVIYPRVMSRSVDIPGAVIVIAALVGAGLLGVVGALLAIPTAAAVLLLVREVFVRSQDER